MKLLAQISLLAFSSAAVSTASAVTVSELGITPPSENVEESYTAGNASYQWRNNVQDGRRDLGQSFLAASDFTMDSFSFRTDGNVQFGASGASFTATVYESSDITSIGTSISSQSGNYLTQASNPVVGNWLLFDLEEDVDLRGGKYYTILLSWDSAGVTDQDQVFLIDDSNGYSDGRLWQDNGSGPVSIPSFDMVFSVQSIPEASTLAYVSVLGLSGLALAMRRRR